ncbi:hypothetical protein [Amycolatopsis sp. NBC_01480]|jgi:hypothetical protein|uniref:hypothetical protein n=1 Tax=Amycolatopsis sp. NBC_01480 TaxID=2903562 RepID=UPI002E2E87C7|nr:hypothetical protein [Amycolatopsis sp. NBC_01480]
MRPLLAAGNGDGAITGVVLSDVVIEGRRCGRSTNSVSFSARTSRSSRSND